MPNVSLSCPAPHRLFVSLYECNWDGVDADDLLQEQIPPLLLAAADSLVDGAGVASAAEAAAPASEGASEGQAAATFTEPMLQQLEQQGRFVGQLADMLYALAVLACDTAERSARAHAAADAGVDGLPVDSSSSTDGSSGSSTGGDAQQHWYQSDGMHQLLEAVAARSTSWDMGCVSRKVSQELDEKFVRRGTTAACPLYMLSPCSLATCCLAAANGLAT